MNVMLGRISLVAIAAVLAASTGFATVATWAWNWSIFLPAATNKATRVNTVVAVSAYMAAMIGVIIALLAYWQASGRATLEPKITFPSLEPNKLLFDAYKPLQTPGWIDVDKKSAIRMLRAMDGSLSGTIIIRNRARYAAQNPGLRITFAGLYLAEPAPGWSIVDSLGETRGIRAIQWDGGSEKIIHGKWSRKLPGLDFTSVIVYRLDPPPELIMTVVSDGCTPRSWHVALNLRLSVTYRRHYCSSGGRQLANLPRRISASVGCLVSRADGDDIYGLP